MIDEYCRRAKVARVVDGDTIDFDIDLGWDIVIRERCRLYGVDTPEMRTEEGKAWKSWVKTWLQHHDPVWIRCREYRLGKYGRSLVEVFSDKDWVCLNDQLPKREY